ncbi:MAG: FkbM family methyltransferase [Candidatus Eisenbacteria bacterium]|uniref:FkbM family methyltransferase n=1 Tax=Eiseniibacteriota bacterium TaxID=2212470 RepID=A0A538TTP0_UNCEI|nr:MAG: FkbM family methyltransferase [Candidatus Eisenbacteria bacterium]TMQ66993.1 MAG: FkbM family methyltransferase [Candidatus Eisenbacteria bacterium]
MVDLAIRALGRACEGSSFLARGLRRARFKGRCRIVNAMRRVPFPPELTAECGGLRFDLDLRDDVQRGIYFGCYEPRDLSLVSSLVVDGGTCVDVGANVGFYTLHLAKRVGPRGRVFAVEPDPRNASRLRRNLVLNRFDGFVQVAEAAISDKDGRAALHRSDETHSGWGSLAAHAGETSTVEVPTFALDSFLDARGIDRVDLLKADVEGSEIELLRGAERSLRQGRFRYLFIEFNGVRLAERGLGLEDFMAPLEKAGYRPAGAHAELVGRMRRGVIPSHTVWPNLLFEPRD